MLVHLVYLVYLVCLVDRTGNSFRTTRQTRKTGRPTRQTSPSALREHRRSRPPSLPLQARSQPLPKGRARGSSTARVERPLLYSPQACLFLFTGWLSAWSPTARVQLSF